MNRPPDRFDFSVDLGTRKAGLRLSTRKVSEDGAKSILFSNVVVVHDVDGARLTPPAR
jgi:hypothetical protein